MKTRKVYSVVGIALSFFIGANSFAKHHHGQPQPSPAPGNPGPTTPVEPSSLECLDNNGSVLPIDDGRVINLKLSTPNQYLARAHVSGPITAIFPDHSGHNHFEIKIGPNTTDTLEVIYNQSFGSLGTVSVGMNVETCGDFINSDAATAQYPASPDGAIIHWIHATNNPATHKGGFLIINGVVFGQGNGSGA